MLKHYACTECGHPVSLPLSESIKTVTCPRCGDVSMIHDGNVRRIYPALHMHPIDHVGELAAVSKWMPTRSRPVRPGWYDCRFRTTEPHVLRLQWDGKHWYSAANERVDTRQFLSWRGMLA